jgi:hypothetical protein
VSSTDISLTVEVAIWSSQAALITTVVLVVTVLILRLRHNDKRNRVANLAKQWRPILGDVVFGQGTIPLDQLPVLARRDHDAFLEEWNHAQDVLSGKSAQRLNAVARALDLESEALLMLRKRGVHRRLLATATLGHLQESAGWDSIVDQLESRNTLLSLVSALALVRIDADRAVGMLGSHLLSRTDWPIGRIASMLRELPPALLADRLFPEILRAPAERRQHLLPLLTLLSPSDSGRVINDLLQKAADEETIIACLNAAQSPDELPLIRHLVRHESWPIRMQAVKALGRTGSAEDTPLIINALSDREWWVRYRAAQALAHLPWINASKLREIQTSQADHFAGDILEHVIAELQFA